ncbi:MAG: rRNA (adenine1518-N6/adenine1519-N6)-dimethyltransferase [Campylobacterota bacterium]|nr:rRNA (adenine1518-N6/adenine1519-N6)-dimethyltransferase [Campylobacterota bacterium]
MIKAKKQFGQNFLKSEYYKDKIIESMPNSDNIIVEVGPGLGDLTEKLLKKRATVAIEIDDRLHQGLRVKFHKELTEGRFKLICGDAMELREKGEFIKEPYDLVANLPYYIATAIILDALRDRNCRNILVMVQKEVAQKFTAAPKTKEYSSLSILASMVGTARALFDVPKEAFVPMPKIVSSVFEIRKNDNEFNEEFASFLKIAFSQPRKKLFTNLALKFDKDILEKSFQALSLNDSVRPHEVEALLFFRLFSKIMGKKDYDDGREF